MEELGAGVRLVGAWPLETAERLQPGVAHAARERGRHRPELVPHRFRGGLAEVHAEPLRDLRHDPEFVLGAARRLDRLAAALHAALAVRHRAFAFAPGRGRG